MTGPTGAVTESTYDYLGRRSTSTQVERSTGSGTAAATPRTTPTTTPARHRRRLAVPADQPGRGDHLLLLRRGRRSDLGHRRGRRHHLVRVRRARPAGRRSPTPTAPRQRPATTARATPSPSSELDASGTTLSTTSAAYDGEGDQLSATDAAGNSTTFTYDPTGMLTQEVQPVSATSGITTSFGYDAAGNQTRYTDGKGNQWWDTYNSWGLQESRVEPSTSAYTTTRELDVHHRLRRRRQPGHGDRAGRRDDHQHLQQPRRADRPVRDRGRRGHADADVRLRPGRRPDLGDHDEHGGHRVERDQRVVHLRRPRPAADRGGIGRVDDARLQRGRAGHVGRGRGRHHRPTPTTTRTGWRPWPTRPPGPRRPTPTTPTPR